MSNGKAEKRLARKTAQKSRKVARKQAEQTSSFSLVLDTFHSPAWVRDHYQVATPYPNLPSDPEAEIAQTNEIQRIIQRPPKYHAKYAAQEFSLLRLALPFLSKGAVGVVDIGAGNANLACLINLIFRVPVLCVDRDPPPPALSGDTRLPPNQVTRIEADIGALELEKVLAWTQEKQLAGVLVLAKHLCGLGTDLAIEFVACLKLKVRVVGIIAATCCCNKLSGEDAEKYVALYGRAMGSSATSSTEASSADDADPFSLDKVETMARCSGYRNNAQSQYARATPEMVELAEAFEDALQAPRHRRLLSLFGRCEERKYVPSSFSLQNRVLIAGERQLEESEGKSENKDAQEHTAGLDRLMALMTRRIEEAGETWPLDFRPQGFGSLKFEYDGS